MTPLETLLIAIIWVGYGAFAFHQQRDTDLTNDAPILVAWVIFSPIVFVVKALYGAFKEYH